MNYMHTKGHNVHSSLVVNNRAGKSARCKDFSMTARVNMAAMYRVQESAQLLSSTSSCKGQEDAGKCVVSVMNLH